jgi:hypothetical protein
MTSPVPLGTPRFFFGYWPPNRYQCAHTMNQREWQSRRQSAITGGNILAPPHAMQI